MSDEGPYDPTQPYPPPPPGGGGGGFGGDGGDGGDSGGYEPEYEPPPGAWWNQPGALIALAVAAVAIVLGIVALVVFTGSDGDSDDTLPGHDDASADLDTPHRRTSTTTLRRRRPRRLRSP